ncbi:activator and specificity factor for anaphase promoting complex [Dunaliella salina]|uniref:Activator and specificity factor for anaphase promoting complex n=2 Tax=Dunaliella salina TaxID=3046 RepID=A0ABQ7GEP7_DUNSA|nr:activator and specificity factor for anaphase promoting complex [Dunaliella salina]|eukprot:KAF5833078.1 activator and specificity factor for anaphase promoting complex [Dunaliella salina]
MEDWENLPSTSEAAAVDFGSYAGLQASPHRGMPQALGSPAYRSPQQHLKLSDRFIPTRTAAARLDYSILDRELVTAEVSRSASEREDLNPAYNLLLRSELLGGPSSSGQIPADKAQQLEQLKAPCSPSKKLFRYKSGDAASPFGGPASLSPYSMSPVGADAGIASSPMASPRRAQRKIPRAPFKVLDAPALQDDFYLNMVDWSSQNVLAVGLGPSVYLWSASTSNVSKLCDLPAGDVVCSVAWSQRGTYLSVGCNSGKVQIWDAARMRLVRTMEGHRARVGTMAWGSHVLSSGSRDRTILQRDVRAPEHFSSKLQGHRSEICGLKWSPDDRQLASGGNDNLLLVWQLGSSNPAMRFTEHKAAVKAITWSPHQHGLLASGGGTADRCIRFWNTASGLPINAIDTGSQVCNLAWSKNANEIVSTHGYSQNQIIVWKYPSMAKLTTLTGHTLRCAVWKYPRKTDHAHRAHSGAWC